MNKEKVQENLQDIRDSVNEIEEEVNPKKGKTMGDPVVELN